MAFIKDKMDRMIQAGHGAIMLWVASKALGGLAIGALLAAYFPHDVWKWIGWALLVLAILLRLPVIKVCWCKLKESPEHSPPDKTPTA